MEQKIRGARFYLLHFILRILMICILVDPCHKTSCSSASALRQKHSPICLSSSSNSHNNEHNVHARDDLGYSKLTASSVKGSQSTIINVQEVSLGPVWLYAGESSRVWKIWRTRRCTIVCAQKNQTRLIKFHESLFLKLTLYHQTSQSLNLTVTAFVIAPPPYACDTHQPGRYKPDTGHISHQATLHNCNWHAHACRRWRKRRLF